MPPGSSSADFSFFNIRFRDALSNQLIISGGEILDGLRMQYNNLQFWREVFAAGLLAIFAGFWRLFRRSIIWAAFPWL